jgi:Reverse transcriptase (RNA-dependent DNA polymerase)
VILLSCWVTSIKATPTGPKCKAAFVIKGCTQGPGRDFDETHAPTVSRETLWLVMALARPEKKHLVQLDVQAAFLYVQVYEEVLTELLKYVFDKHMREKKVALLCKAIYGPLQAPLLWNREL